MIKQTPKYDRYQCYQNPISDKDKGKSPYNPTQVNQADQFRTLRTICAISYQNFQLELRGFHKNETILSTQNCKPNQNINCFEKSDRMTYFTLIIF